MEKNEKNKDTKKGGGIPVCLRPLGARRTGAASVRLEFKKLVHKGWLIAVRLAPFGACL